MNFQSIISLGLAATTLFAAPSASVAMPQDGVVTEDVAIVEQVNTEMNSSRFAFGRGMRMSEMTEEEKAERAASMDEKLSEKLASGEITQEQYNAIMSGDFSLMFGKLFDRMKNAEDIPFEVPEDFEWTGGGGFGRFGGSSEMPELSEEDAEARRAQIEEVLSEKLANGEITQKQYDAIMSGDFSSFTKDGTGGFAGRFGRGQRSGESDDQV